MATKRDRMRKKAQLDLQKRSGPETEQVQKEPKKAPSFASGFWMILLGSTTMIIFFTIGQTFLGIMAGAAFTFIGSMRISKASSAKSKKSTLQS
ncbi:MAG: hypothetical protein ACXAD7_15245 [Candidatus Kariarchaeaceae archaeon]|jgi:hypothetical protein